MYLINLNFYASLIDLGKENPNLAGLIYDTKQDLTWVKDANLAKILSSPYVDNNGLMSRESTFEWVDTLTIAGYNDWRVPSVSPMDVIQLSDCPFNGGNCGYT